MDYCCYGANLARWFLGQPRALPPGEWNGPEYLVKCIDEDRPIEGPSSPEICRDAQEILEAGLRSISSGRVVPLPLH